eukprot:Rmarinus@m.4870
MYGGDEISAIVLEVGSHTTKGGYAGEDCPKVVVSSSVGVYTDERGRKRAAGENGAAEPTSKKYYTGFGDIVQGKEHMDIQTPYAYGEDPSSMNWDVVEALWSHVLREKLMADMSEHPLVVTEPTFNTNTNREKALELAFEQFDVPAMFVAKDAVLSSFASARPTALVLDCGAAETTAVPVHDGYVLKKAAIRTPLAGDFLSLAVDEELQRQSVEVRPHFTFKKKQDTSTGKVKVESISVPSGVRPSYLKYGRSVIVNQVKQSTLRVAASPMPAMQNTMETDGDDETFGEYELPDGRSIVLGRASYAIPEMLFQPQIFIDTTVSSFDEFLRDSNGNPIRASLSGLHQVVHESISRCDPDVQRDLYGGVIVTGGTTLLPGFPERMQQALAKLTPHIFKLKVIAPPSSNERRFSVWIGGSILASLGSFQQLWVSSAEYKEHGPAIVHKRCP